MNSRIRFVLLGLILGLVVAMIAGVESLPTFFDLGCKGTYVTKYFFRLDRVCDDCYALFRNYSLAFTCR